MNVIVKGLLGGIMVCMCILSMCIQVYGDATQGHAYLHNFVHAYVCVCICISVHVCVYVWWLLELLVIHMTRNKSSKVIFK